MAGSGCVVFLLLCALMVVNCQQGSSTGEEADDPTSPHRNPSKCEVCKFVAIELQGIMEDTSKNREVLKLGHQFDKEQKKIPYKYSELRLIEALDGVCERIMEYNIHAERDSSRRFAKGRSETFETLHGLVDRGVKVDLGIPYNMWDEPSAPVHTLKKYCDMIIEQHEESIENWFRGNQEKTLMDYLCAERVLSREESECLNEEWTGVERVDHGANDDESSNEENPDEEKTENDAKGKKKGKGDEKKVQKEIERQARLQEKQQEAKKKMEKQKERDQRKREKELERIRRAKEDSDGDRKMEKEMDDKRKIQREIERQAERERMIRERHGDDYLERRREERERDWQRRRDQKRSGGMYDGDDEMEEIRRRYMMDDEDMADKFMEREMRKHERDREERRRRHMRNEL